MSTPDRTEMMFTASSAAKACGVGRSTVHRYLEQGRLSGAEKDAEGVWRIPLSALLSVGWAPGRSASVVDSDREHDRTGDRDGDRHVSLEVHELMLQLERARAEARIHADRAASLERERDSVARERDVYMRMLEAAPVPDPDRSQAAPQPVPDPLPTPDPISAMGTDRPKVGRFRRALNVARFG